MRFTDCATVFALSTAALALPARENALRFKRDTTSTSTEVGASSRVEYIPGAYIIEFEDAAKMKKRADGGDHNQAFINDLQKQFNNGSAITSGETFDSSMFEGIAVTIKQTGKADPMDPEAEMALIAKIPGVRSVSPDRNIPLVGDEPEAVGSEAEKQKWSTHTKTGVEELHKKGIKGAGVKVCILDTGIDKAHPAFTGRFKGGYDATVLFDQTKLDTATEKLNLMDVSDAGRPDQQIVVNDLQKLKASFENPQECEKSGHGTHVAGIAAGSEGTWVGVAPEADIHVYKVFKCKSDGDHEKAQDSNVIKAFELAIGDGCDVINLSVGAYSDATTAFKTAIDKVTASGILLVVSAGNDGEYGPFYQNNYAEHVGTLAVGNIEHDQVVVPITVTAKGGETELKVTVNQDIGSGFNTKAGGGGDSTLTLQDYPSPCVVQSGDDAATKLVGKVAMIDWKQANTKSCTPKKVGKIVTDQGGGDILFYTSSGKPGDDVHNSDTHPGLLDTDLNWGYISTADAKRLKTMLQSEEEVKVTFPAPTSPDGDKSVTLGAGKMSVSSTWGLTNTGKLKPEVSAPGGKIFSAYPRNLGKYAILSGTSMAAPYACGVAALLVQEDKKKGVRTHDQVYVDSLKSRIITSGQLLPWFDGTSKTSSATVSAPIAQQGAGRINAVIAMNPSALVDQSVLTMSPTDNKAQTFKVKITNPTTAELKYTLTDVAALTVNAFQGLEGIFTKTQRSIVKAFPPDSEKAVAKIEFKPEGLTLAAGANAEVEVKITPPTGLNAKRLPIYSGKIIISSGEDATAASISIPYVGLAGSLKSDVTIINSVKFTNKLSWNNRELKEGDKFPQRYTADLIDFIGIEFSADFWTPEINVQLEKEPFGAGDRFPLDRVGKDWLSTGRYCPSASKTEIAEHLNKFTWAGEYDDGNPAVPVGDWRIMVSALKPLGDKTKDSDFEIFTSPKFTVYKKTVIPPP